MAQVVEAEIKLKYKEAVANLDNKELSEIRKLGDPPSKIKFIIE